MDTTADEETLKRYGLAESEDTALHDDSIQDNSPRTNSDVLFSVPESLTGMSYDEKISTLKSVYENTTWDDKEKAARNIADITDIYNKSYGAKPEVKLGTDAASVIGTLMDPNLSQDDKVREINEWVATEKSKLYSQDFDTIANAKAAEEQLDQFGLELRRSAVTKDIGFIRDTIARGIDTAITPILGTADAFLGTETKKSFSEFAAMNSNTEADGGVRDTVIRAAGSIVGVSAATAMGPWTALGYLGSMVVDQTATVHDTILKETNDQDKAWAGVAESSPYIVAGMLSDRLLGVKLAKTLTGKTGAMSVFKGAGAGAAGNLAQSYGMSQAIADQTGNKDYEASAGRLAVDALVGGAVGGTVAAVTGFKGDVNAARVSAGVKKFYEDQKAILTKRNAEKLQASAKAVRDEEATQFADDPFIHMVDRSETAPDSEIPVAVPKPLIDVDARAPEGRTSTESIDADNRNDRFSTEDAPADESLPPPLMYELIRAIGGRMKTHKPSEEGGAYGYAHDKGTDKNGKEQPATVSILNRQYKSLPDLYNTMAHEFTHFLDYMRSNFEQGSDSIYDIPSGGVGAAYFKSVELLAQKLYRVKDAAEAVAKNPQFLEQAKRIASEWSGSWEGARKGYKDYRESSAELYADVGSAIFNKPEWVAKEAPELYAAFIDGIKNSSPEVAKFWDDYQEAIKNPEKLREMMGESNTQTREKLQNFLNSKAVKDHNDSVTSFKDSLKTIANYINVTAIDQRGIIRKLAKSFAKGDPRREQVYKLLSDTYASAASQNNIDITIDQPISALFDKFKAKVLALDPNADVKKAAGQLSDLMLWQHLVSNKTAVEKNIHDNPLDYGNGMLQQIKSAVAYMRSGRNKEPLSEVDRLSIDGKTGNQLTDALSKLHSYLSDGQLKATRDILAKNLENVLKAENEATAAPSLKKDKTVLKEGEVDPVDQYRNMSPDERQQAIKDMTNAMEVLHPDAFRSARHIPNAKNTDALTAERNLKSFEASDPKLFALASAAARELRDTLHNVMMPIIENSGRFSPELIETFKRNKDSYMTMASLEHFMKDPEIDGVVKARYGSVGEIVDPIYGTIAKTKAIIDSANYQIAQNAVIDAARLSNDTVEEVPVTMSPRRRGSNQAGGIWDTKNKLQKQDPANSYLVGFKDGKPTLYKISGKDWAQVTASSEMAKHPVVGWFAKAFEWVNKWTLAREFKTGINAAFWAASKVMDRGKEAAQWGSYEVSAFLGFHTNKVLKGTNAANRPESQDYVVGKLTPKTEFLTGANALMRFRDAESGGYAQEQLKAENAWLSLSGQGLKDVQPWWAPEKFNRKANELLDKTGILAWVRHKTNVDEVKAKLNMFDLAILQGKGLYEAADMARVRGGTADPMGGGREAKTINKLALFGRAQLNGLRAFSEMFQENKLGMTGQWAVRCLVPRLMANPVIAGGLIALAFGDEWGEKTKKFLGKISSYDRNFRTIIPLGFTDAEGNFVGWNVNSEDINSEYKAQYLRLPVARDLTTISQALNPIIGTITDLIETGEISIAGIGKKVADARNQIFASQIAPAGQYALQLSDIFSGENPTDYFRNRGILSKDVAEAGSLVQKFYEYSLWALYNDAPGMFAYQNDKSYSTDAETFVSQMSSVPLLGATMKRFIGSSNYGELESSQAAKDAKTRFDADVRLNTGDDTQTLFNNYRKNTGTINMLGKGWQEKMSTNRAQNIRAIQRWHTDIYEPYINEIRAAHERGDTEALDELKRRLESESTAWMDKLKEAGVMK